MMENNAPGRGKLKVTGIIYTVLGALSILGSLLILGAGGLLLASDNDVGWSWGPRPACSASSARSVGCSTW